MNGQITQFEKKQHIADEFIVRVNPYQKPKTLQFDLRGYAHYVKKNNLSRSEISESDMEQFVKY